MCSIVICHKSNTKALNAHTELRAWNLLLNGVLTEATNHTTLQTSVGINNYAVEQDERLIYSVTCMCCRGCVWLLQCCVEINSTHVKVTAQPYLPTVRWLCANTDKKELTESTMLTRGCLSLSMTSESTENTPS